MQVVEIKKFDLVTTTEAIVQGVGRSHDTIIRRPFTVSVAVPHTDVWMHKSE